MTPRYPPSQPDDDAPPAWRGRDLRVTVVSRAFQPGSATRHPWDVLLLPLSLWVAPCLAGAVFSAQRAPGVSMALVGSLAGAFAGFLVGNADGPADVPAYSAVGASIGLFAAGLVGFVVARPRPSSRGLRRAGALVLAAAPFAAAAMTVLLRLACPLYVTGPDTGYCDFQEQDLLGGWVSGVIAAFLVDAVLVAALLFASAWRVRCGESDADRSRHRLRRGLAPRGSA